MLIKSPKTQGSFLESLTHMMGKCEKERSRGRNQILYNMISTNFESVAAKSFDDLFTFVIIYGVGHFIFWDFVVSITKPVLSLIWDLLPNISDERIANKFFGLAADILKTNNPFDLSGCQNGGMWKNGVYTFGIL